MKKLPIKLVAAAVVVVCLVWLALPEVRGAMVDLWFTIVSGIQGL